MANGNIPKTFVLNIATSYHGNGDAYVANLEMSKVRLSRDDVLSMTDFNRVLDCFVGKLGC